MKITLQNITKQFESVTAVNNFSAELPDGNLICLLGPSGCGKSTILNILCGILDVTSGQIFFDGKDVTKLPPDKRNIGMVFQNYALYPHMTVLENIAFPLEVKKVPKKERTEKAMEIAKLVHVDSLIKRFPGELSGGQQQRVAIARALVKNPMLLLMDEPLSNLDARLRLEMREEIRRIQQETGVTTVFVTHDQEEAMSISDSILLMKDGFLIQKGLCQDLYNDPNCSFVADFLGNPQINKIKLTQQEYIESKLSNYFHSKDNSHHIVNIMQNVSANSHIIVSIRPESFTFGNDFEAEVLNISEMGKEQIITLKFFNTQVRAILNTDKQLELGQKISLSLKNKGVFLFDEKTGERLA